MQLVAHRIAFQLAHPPFPPVRRRRAVPAATMACPKQPWTKMATRYFGRDDVGADDQRAEGGGRFLSSDFRPLTFGAADSHVQPKPIAHPMQQRRTTFSGAVSLPRMRDMFLRRSGVDDQAFASNGLQFE